MTFHVGQKVVCIASFSKMETRYRLNVPKKDAIYTVRGVQHYGARGLGLLLSEIHNGAHDTTAGLEEPRFTAEGFRPLVERKTDISIFTAMLNPSRDKVQA